ncbi:MAG: transcriptional repressor [Gammaproteobacteria bacterium]|nr:transcriptional repressor [Gammaproteobacteria bacterium]MBU2678435.1 transcriptional repressor [Gammaproteobacteria bacterium]NNL52170.1 transcriptional repressor [Woeseiaceae bacterium]
MVRSDILAQFDLHGILPTPQRLEIADILMAKPQHLSAEQIIDRLRQSGSRVSKATVYNTLNLFGECGLVKELFVDPDRRYYDSSTLPHHHFYNVDTGALTDIDEDKVIFSELPELPEGTESQSVQVMIKVRNRSD